MKRLLLSLAVFVLLCTFARAESKRLLLIGQEPDNHPKGTHEYNAGMRILEECLKGVPDLEVVRLSANGKWAEGPELVDRADGVVLFVSQGAKWMRADPKRYKAFADLAARRGGIVVLHWGMGTREAENVAPALRLFGGCHGGPDRKYKVLKTSLQFEKHPITNGLKPLELKEEFYYKLKFVKNRDKLTPIAKAKIEGNLETVGWAWTRPDGGRSFGFTGLHFHEHWQIETYRRLVAQATLWTLGLDIPKKGLPVAVPAEKLKVLDSDR